MTNSPAYIMYGCPVSLYTGKARSYMRKKGISYTERLQSHPDYFGKIVPKVGRIVIPVIEAENGDTVQDTTEIIDYLESKHNSGSAYPTGPKQKILSLIFELFGDEGLLKPAMHYRWNFDDDNDDFISLEFGRFMNPVAEDEDAKQLAAMPKAKMSGLLPALGITEETKEAIEASYHDLLDALNAHFLKHPYLFGGAPSIGDFGLYAPLYAHLGRDPAPSMIMKKKANRVWRWVERMTASDADMPEFPDLAPTFYNDDQIPETITPILQVIAKDYLPELKGLVGFINQHLADNPAIGEGDAVIKDANARSLGFFTATIRDTEFSLVARHYSIWMLQRVQDAFATLSSTDAEEVRSCLSETGLEEILDLKTNRRIERDTFKEIWGQTQ